MRARYHRDHGYRDYGYRDRGYDRGYGSYRDSQHDRVHDRLDYLHERAHEVTLTRPYYLGVFPVTQGEYAAVTGGNPSAFSRGGNRAGQVSRFAAATLADFPVENVSWEDAQAFLSRLTALPAEKKASVAIKGFMSTATSG